MRGKKATKDADVRLKYLRFRVHVERYPLDDLLDGILKTSFIIENNKCVERINEGDGEVAIDVVIGNIISGASDRVNVSGY